MVLSAQSMVVLSFVSLFPFGLCSRSCSTTLGSRVCSTTGRVRMAPGRPLASDTSGAEQDSSRSETNQRTITSRPRNVLGSELRCCCLAPRTGFYRDGWCQTGEQDLGRHTVCAIMTDEFLHFSASRGNDLMTPMPQYSFPGLKAGDKWCLCVLRWKEAFDAGVAPHVVLEACHEKSLEYVNLDDLRAHAVPSSESSS